VEPTGVDPLPRPKPRTPRMGRFAPRKYTTDEYQNELQRFSDGQSLGRLRYGRWDDVESLADEMIRLSLVGVTKYSEKADILTNWKLAMRQRREVLMASGTPDASIRRGMYKRCANSANKELNSRMGITRARNSSSASYTDSTGYYYSADED
jgi:hypothetical protein